MRRMAILSCLLLALVTVALSSCELAAGQVLAQFTLEVEPTEVTIAAGSAENVTVRTHPLAGIQISTVNVSLTKKPVGVEANDIIVYGESEWEIRVRGSVQPGEYELEVQGVSQGLNLIPVTRTVTLTLTVTESEEDSSD